MWDLPGPGLEPVSPALAGGFLTTVPPGKPLPAVFISKVLLEHNHTHTVTYCFHTTVAELSSCDRVSSPQPKMFTLWPFTESLLTPGLDIHFLPLNIAG